MPNFELQMPNSAFWKLATKILNCLIHCDVGDAVTESNEEDWENLEEESAKYNEEGS